MTPQAFSKTIALGDGRTITLETGKLARQAQGSVVVRMGNTMLLGTVVSNYDAREGIDFLPLTVEYREKFYASGRIPGGFLKREGRPYDEEVLTMRLVDRVLRPLFPEDYHAETQVIIYLISHDEEHMADSLAGLAASAAIALSDIPFNGPMSEVRVGRIDGKLKINPSSSEMERSDLDIMVGATADSIVMVEGEMKEISEQEMVEAIRFAHDAIKVQVAAQLELAAEFKGAIAIREYSHETHDEALREKIRSFAYDKVYAVAKSGQAKHDRSAAFKAVREEFLESLPEEERDAAKPFLSAYFGEVEYDAMRAMILDEGLRLDGRKPDEIRPIWCEVDYLPSAHGSAVFTRGETQSLTAVTLGSKLDENRIDMATFQGAERFYLHYNFPPFSTGEARPMRGTSRREIGHGNLAQRALEQVLPADNPYVIRVVSDILESNGSSSMATVCAGTLALMDAGIPLTKPVSGIAMGLITDPNSGRYAVLSDILGDEDHLGDMDFKVCGTKDGITACQMDIKIKGLNFEILEKALMQAREGRMHILGEMMKALDAPRPELKPHAPRILIIRIPKEFIGAVIGPGGKIIQGIQAETGANIAIEEVGNEGIVEIATNNGEAMAKAEAAIKAIVWQPEVGETYMGTVRSIMPFGAFVEINKGTDGLLHISEIEWRRLEKVEDVLKEGDKIEVKLIGKDERGKLKLSRKVLLPRPERNGTPEN
ncbi:polyribonucleotide nucleotidyltransferase [bacterium]|nr:polyribonucleotide nucleotidyltransferase [bacterium]